MSADVSVARSLADGHIRNAALHWLWCAVLLIVAVHALTLRSASSWAGTGSDLGISIVHGLNLLEGRNFFDTSGYTTPALEAGAAPRTYPAVYSLLQASLFRLAGFENFFLASKRLQIAALFCMLSFFALFVRRRDGPWLALLSLAAFGLSPFLFEFKELIRPELYFGAILYGLFCYVDRVDGRTAPTANRSGRRLPPILMALCFYGLIAVRSIGIVMLPAVVLYDLVTRRRIRAATLVAVVGALTLYFLQGRLLGGAAETSYAAEFATTPSDIVTRALINAKAYYYVLISFFSFADEGTDGTSVVLLLVTLASFIVGLVASLRRSIGLHDMFFAGYFVVLLLHETVSAWARYMLLAMPMLFYYALLGLQLIGNRLPTAVRGVQMLLYGLLLLAAYGSVYSRALILGPIETGPTEANFLAMSRSLSALTPDGSVIAAREPLWVRLASGRTVAQSPLGDCCSDPTSKMKVRRYLAASDADFILLKATPRHQVGYYGFNRWSSEDSPGFRAWVLSDRQSFTELARRGVYRLYRLNATGAGGAK